MKFRVDEYTDYAIQSLPDGKALYKKFDTESVIYKYMSAVGKEFFSIQALSFGLINQFYWEQTSLLLPEWLKAKGLPDGCFNAFGSQEEELNAVRFKVHAKGTQTAQKIVDLFSIIGYTVEVYAGRTIQLNPTIAPDITFSSDKEARNSIVIIYLDNPSIGSDNIFPVPFPWPFYTDPRVQVSCAIKKLVPATDQVLFSDQS